MSANPGPHHLNNAPIVPPTPPRIPKRLAVFLGDLVKSIAIVAIWVFGVSLILALGYLAILVILHFLQMAKSALGL